MDDISGIMMFRATLNVLVKFSGVSCMTLKFGSNWGNPLAGEFSTSKSARPVSPSHSFSSIMTNTSLDMEEADRNPLPSHDESRSIAKAGNRSK
ncbi:hypothetical protein SDC9_132815 [bioreactor metagenome]|uniref:Uncharacterized protein n=1 Tax=bioreactor metagenome TaxID=1076179 RepID=A0A645D8U8_9ZZZZ